jgi:arylformamidase
MTGPRTYDISPPISPQLAVWPGDVPFSRELTASLASGDEVTTSALRATAHLGAHADAPSHFLAGAPTIDAIEISTYVGACQVIRVHAERGATIPSRTIASIRAPRVLLATGTYPDPSRFNHDFAAPSVELIERLHAARVLLLGVDTPSVDLSADAHLPVHRRCAELGIAIVEGLVLQDIPEGTYDLIALPLRLAGFEASPVRAILREHPHQAR